MIRGLRFFSETEDLIWAPETLKVISNLEPQTSLKVCFTPARHTNSVWGYSLRREQRHDEVCLMAYCTGTLKTCSRCKFPVLLFFKIVKLSKCI